MTSRLLTPLVFFAAAGLCIAGAWGAVVAVEQQAATDVGEALEEAGLGWAEVRADGLRVDLSGIAPDEAARFRAASVAGGVVDPERVIDRMDVATRDPAAPPRFSMEILRSGDGITLIGLVPAETDRQGLLDAISSGAEDVSVTDLLETASYPAPRGWAEAVTFGLDALELTERAKISVAADGLGVTTMAPDPAARDMLEVALRDAAPDGAALALDVKVPRPVLTPFLLRLVKTPEGAELNACAADTEVGRDAILAAARAAGTDGTEGCTLGMGVPSAAWPDAAERGIAALATLPSGTLTLTDLAMRIDAGPETEPATLESLADELRTDLPEEFSLVALAHPEEADAPELQPPDFVAIRNPEGQVTMEGRLGTALERDAVDSFARALFGLDHVGGEIDVAPGVPDGWSPRIFAALDALSLLAGGRAEVTEDIVRISGTTAMEEAETHIGEIVAARLGPEADTEIDVTYDARLDPELALPTPEECAAEINSILTLRQITFAPGSDEIDTASRESVDAIADILRQCEDVTMEVAGYTDSQGGEEMNRRLSQSRADALIAALMARRIVTAPLTAVGYGEEDPIADNSTPEGREANRRIEFRLLVDDAPAEDAAAEDAEEEDAAAAEADNDEAGQ
ncbi:OOP family OmpA-OmpF porin [Palleronia aestuarii]|uniref:OOP family OmpA-OmpF porin n=1 Tax=Palleronia aestuarii TaxID=568105 RepID=A0A2W7MZ27_9RHOB|nr:OmpA family protein [Palleronia aestuarii]PZX11407.1 OOP family OmpA-OmpF porin [Palleronia aestuarii]